MNFDDGLIDESRQMLKICSCGALVCFIVIILAVAIQAVTGAMLAISACGAPPPDEAARVAAAQWHCSVKAVHALVGQASLVPAVVLMTLAILFALHIGDVETKHTRFCWAQAVRSGLLCIMLFGMAVGGRIFVAKLTSADFWLFKSAESASEGAGVTIDGFGSTAFYTFIGLHGVVLPMLVIIAIIFMWPSSFEFLSIVSAKRPRRMKARWKPVNEDPDVR